jgi:very-short-patch-repair endonuclease
MIEDYLRRQNGVITYAQARRSGLCQDAINRRVNSGRWQRCARGVYFADDRPFTDAARIRAAVWSYGVQATASALAAAWWHGLTPTAPNEVEVTVPRRGHGRARAGSIVRRRDLAAVDVVVRHHLRVTAVSLTVLEAAVTPGGAAIMDAALQHRVALDDLYRVHERNARRHGGREAGRLLKVASGGARSEAERLLIRLLKAAGISGWRPDYPVGGYRIDVAFPTQRVAVEVDGWAFHTDRAAFQRDRVRQNRISLHGWQVLRFTWLDLTEQPARVVAEIKSAIGLR